MDALELAWQADPNMSAVSWFDTVLLMGNDRCVFPSVPLVLPFISFLDYALVIGRRRYLVG